MKIKWITIILPFLTFANVKPLNRDCQLNRMIDTKNFMLDMAGNNRRIYIRSNNLCKDISFPRQWLKESSQDKKNMPEGLEILFDNHVSAFQIAPNLIGFHLSSYQIQEGGSAQAASGRDVFLIYNIHQNAMQKGITDLGITKKRYRFSGCFSALHSKFLLSDIDNNGFIDIGMLKVELLCKQLRVNGDEIVEGPFYISQSAKWYRFLKDNWIYSPEDDARFPQRSYWELPLIGIVKNPVEYVMELSRKVDSDSSGEARDK